MIRILFLSPFISKNVDSQTHVTFEIFSTPMLYSICGYICWVFYLVFVIILNWESFGSDYSDVILNASIFFFYAPLPLIPITFWVAMPKVVTHLSLWEKFDCKYLDVTGKALVLGLHRKVMLMIVTVPLTTVLISVGYQSFTDAGLNFWYFPLNVYCITIACLQEVRWVIFFEAVTKASRVFQGHLQETLGRMTRGKQNEMLGGRVIYVNKIKSGDLTALRQCRYLWLQLSELTIHTASALFPAIALDLLVQFTGLTLTCYLLFADLDLHRFNWVAAVSLVSVAGRVALLVLVAERATRIVRPLS
uniref:Gustatory receptor n=1 Tax=Timema bartmani TaxID=61472 RepID=A0A7R9ES52_9NEOP|nr:unnamed protein product [Timema bartmani]